MVVKNKMIAKIQYANHNNNDAWKSILISDKVNFGKKYYQSYRELCYNYKMVNLLKMHNNPKCVWSINKSRHT